jgi:hypothetical protein
MSSKKKTHALSELNSISELASLADWNRAEINARQEKWPESQE